ncbi:MarR family winged helix-turn-helix transcriptional regulator [Cytobacillus gottheilii]|uniref:MarR family transcriptional regulator n=1 Tax=Cytobacillus gottheilii TaxID=859144 RepID=A0ABX8F9F1_9BACI|nr:MarR family transcriptional regulator [Cytobacillus gottheilii]QVY61040.1 MarR family transcriptional regulator [Cytobacillus gottheilii]
MGEHSIKDLIDRYIEISFIVNRCGQSLVKSQVGSDLTYDQHYTLRHIYKSGSCTSSELAEVFDVKKSAITAIITRLWEKGLILRTRDESDRRVVYLTLTDKAKALFEDTEERIQKLVESLINNFEEDEINQFMDSFEKLKNFMLQSKENIQTEETK